MEYRTIKDDGPLRAEAFHDTALATEQEAFIQEMEVRRRGYLVAHLPKKFAALREDSAQEVERRRDEVVALRAAADAQAKLAKLPEDERLSIRATVLRTYLRALEVEHVNKKARKEMLVGKDSATKKAREALDADITEVEVSHAFTAAELDALEPKLPQASEEPTELAESDEEPSSGAGEPPEPGKASEEPDDADEA